MARNNRELSQLGAFISITDNTQEIGAGILDANEVNRHVMAIGATDHTGLTVPPAIGIGTTNPGKDKVTVLANVNIARQIGGEGGNLIVDQDLKVEAESEIKGILHLTSGLTASMGGSDPNEVSLRVPHGISEFGNEVEVNPAVSLRNQADKGTGSNIHPTGLGVTIIPVNLVDTNIAITTSYLVNSGGSLVESTTPGLSNKVLTEIPVRIDYNHHLQAFPTDRDNPALTTLGFHSMSGPVRFNTILGSETIDPSRYDAALGITTNPRVGTFEISHAGGHIGIEGPLSQGGGPVTVQNISISTYTNFDGTAANGYVLIPYNLDIDYGLQSYSGSRFQGGFLTDDLHVTSTNGISTITGSLYLPSTGSLPAWNVGMGLSDGTGPELQVEGSSQFSGSIRVGLASRATTGDVAADGVMSIQCGAGITATNLHLYGNDLDEKSFTRLETVLVSLGKSSSSFDNSNNPYGIEFRAPVYTNIIPKENGAVSTDAGTLGTPERYWKELWVDRIDSNKLSISTSIVNSGGLYQTGISTFQFGGRLEYRADDPAEFHTPIHASGISSFRTLFAENLTVANDIVGTAVTALQSKRIYVGSAVTAQYYRLVLTDEDGNDDDGSIFVDPAGIETALAYDPGSNILNVPGDIRISGTDAGSDDGVIQILAPQARSTLRMFQTNVSSAEILTQGHRSLSVGSTLGITTINSYRNSIRGDLLLGALGVSTVSISDVNGLENITITGNTLTEMAGSMAMEGDTFDVRNDVFNFCNSNSTIISAFALGDNISIGATVGFTSIRTPILRTAGSIRVDGNLISDSSGSDHIIMIPGSAGVDAITRVAGDLQIDGQDIRVAGGVTNITMNTDINTTFAGDITVGGNEIRNSDGILNITLFGGGLTSIGGTLRIEGDEIQAGTGVTNITLTQNFTQIEKDLRVNGNNIRSSDNNINITMDSNTRTSVSGNLSVGNNIIEASDQQSAITLIPSSGSVAISSNLTVNNDFEVLGSETDIKSENVRIKDTLVSIGLTEGTGTGSLVVPTVDENKDVGLILNYYDAGSKQAALFWDDSLGSVGIASDVSETSSVLTVNQYAKIIAKSIAISDCAGTSDIIQCEGTTRTLANIVIDGGEY